MKPCQAVALLVLTFFIGPGAEGWNSIATLESFYTFQEFYTDAQYGPDFGYYSTGRILHNDGPGTSKEEGAADGQAYFNSYTTQPMSLSPFFGQLLCDRIVSMWLAMGRPTPFFIIEFGGGTGMLARDILRHSRNSHPDFFQALRRYIIGERSVALQSAQQRTASEFVQSDKLRVADADARHASKVRDIIGADSSGTLRGFVLSNELLDEFDPLRLRLFWQASNPPDVERCRLCSAYREAYVLHRIDDAALQALLRLAAREGLNAADTSLGPRSVSQLIDAIRWEGQNLPCGLLDTQFLQKQVVERLAETISPQERRLCSPRQVCCTALLLAVDGLMQDDHASLQLRKLAASDNLLQRYRHQLIRTNGTVLLSKHRYRELRRLALRLGSETEQALLTGGPQLPGRIHSDEVSLALSPARCSELEGWRERHAERLAAAAKVRADVAHVYDRRWLKKGEGTQVLKLIVQPGHAEFVREASVLLDEGYLVSMDYGADADALVWQALVHPNYEGIHIMDARQATSECTGSYLLCPGLQDITMTVDFTEASEAGHRLGGWQTLAYGPIFQLELAFDQWLTEPVPHLLERAGGPRTVALHAWYRHSGSDPWASFKILVQHRGSRGGNWSLGHPDLSWPLPAAPRLREAPSDCWGQDMTKPTLASLITQGATSKLGSKAATSSGDVALLRETFHELLAQIETLQAAIDAQHSWQQQGYRDLHLAQMLSDYWLHLSRPSAASGGFAACAHPDPDIRSSRLADVRALATSRRLTEMHGDEMFSRVFDDLALAVFGNASVPSPGAPPHVCMASLIVRTSCQQAV